MSIGKRRAVHGFLLISCLFLTGCYPVVAMKVGPHIEKVQVLACELYDSCPDPPGPPQPEKAQEVRDYGSSRFSGWLSINRIFHPQCRDLHKYVYAIGWFGNIWHLDLIAECLNHENEEVRHQALAAFNRLSNQNFVNKNEALTWWENHKTEFPRYQQTAE